MLVRVHASHVLEETAVDEQLSFLSMMKERKRVARWQFLDPPAAETQGRRHQDQRGRQSGPSGFESDERAERAADNDCGKVLLQFPDADPRHRAEVEPFKGRDVQIRRDDSKAVGLEDCPQRLDLPSAGRRSEAMKIEDVPQPCLRSESSAAAALVPTRRRPRSERLTSTSLNP